ncbi:unnamed protein product [Bathycoccus prasinos]|mmetsp:Transcript_8344/g.26688  ORF Transcript_8344/g.26688 Transcript_8344/m.26688 type:complete len:413 (+) Transcript_8344:2983-4221(+)
MVFNKRKEEDEEDREEIDDDISNLKRLTRDAFSDIKSLREKVHRLETNLRHSSSSSNSIFHRVKAKVETGFLHPQADENQFNVTASQRVRKGAEMKVNCETHFPKIGHVLTSAFACEGGKLFTEDGQELHAVTLRKLSYKISNAIPSLVPDGVTIRVTPLGFEGRDQFASLSPIQENASLTGFGSTGASYAALGDGDSAVSVGCEVSSDATVNLAMCAGNNTRVDEPTARVIGQGSWRSKRKDNKNKDTNKKNVNYAGALGGSVDANGQKIASVSVAAAIEDVVVSAWVQKDVIGGGGGKSSFSKSKSKRGGGGGGGEDVFEWGVVATKPPSARLKPATATLKDILSPKNLGWGCVFGHSNAVGGEHVELFARVYGDGFQKPSMSLFPGIVINRDERGNFDTAFGMRAHWYL